MAPKLTEEEIRLLHELAEAGGEQSISGNHRHDGLVRLVDLGSSQHTRSTSAQYSTALPGRVERPCRRS